MVCSKGKIEAVGSHRELWYRSPTYRRLHELHSEVGRDVIADESFDTELVA